MIEEELLYDWNRQAAAHWPSAPPLLVEHALPAALLSPSATLPDSKQQADLVLAVSRLGISCFSLGDWPGQASQDVFRHLHGPIQQGVLRCWVETGPRELPATGLSVYVSPRQSGWTSRVKQLGRRATLVIQDVTRIHPDALVDQVRAAAEGGAEAVCLCDDAGRATPSSVTRLVGFVVEARRRLESPLRIEWSGRNDRSLALANALAAWRAGAGGLHCAFFGLGEGSGLVPTEQLVVNLGLLGWRRDMRALAEVSRKVATALSIEIYPNLPVVGTNAFRTDNSTHAAAMLKAHERGHDWLADLIYSGVPATAFGFSQRVPVLRGKGAAAL